MEDEHSLHLYDEELEPSENSIMFRADGQVYEAQKVSGDQYAVALFGNLYDAEPEVEGSPVDTVDVDAHEDLEDLARQLHEGYSGPEEDPLNKARRRRLGGSTKAAQVLEPSQSSSTESFRMEEELTGTQTAETFR